MQEVNICLLKATKSHHNAVFELLVELIGIFIKSADESFMTFLKYIFLFCYVVPYNC